MTLRYTENTESAHTFALGIALQLRVFAIVGLT
jgi:hypothetical protein